MNRYADGQAHRRKLADQHASIQKLLTGRIESGIVRVGDSVEIAGTSDTSKAIVIGIEVMRRAIEQAGAGDYVGVLLRGRQEVRRGQMLAAPGSVEMKD